MSKKTALYQQHLDAQGHMVEFAGWQLPIHYGSQIKEHHAVRQTAGMFDVSHMVIWDIQGTDAKPFLQRLLANDVGQLTTPGKALYGCMLNERAGVIDDLITYYLTAQQYYMITNAATHAAVLAWMKTVATDFKVSIKQKTEWSMLAVQGPQARACVHAVLPTEQCQAVTELPKFHGVACHNGFIARTGYTGEDGYELLLPHEQILTYWQALLAQEVSPCGLGARDTLRLEAGLNLYGQDMDTEHTPLEARLKWTVALTPEDRDFIGRAALEAQQAAGVTQKLVGLKLVGKGVLRHGQRVILDSKPVGVLTSGGYSPTLSASIGLARVPVSLMGTCQVEIRGKFVDAEIVKVPFVG